MLLLRFSTWSKTDFIQNILIWCDGSTIIIVTQGILYGYLDKPLLWGANVVSLYDGNCTMGASEHLPLRMVIILFKVLLSIGYDLNTLIFQNKLFWHNLVMRSLDRL